MPKNQYDLNAGDLRERLEVRKRAVTVKSGITTETWETLCAVWAKAEPLSGRAYFQAAAVNRENSIRFIIRYRADVTAEMTIRWRGTDYGIESVVNPGGRNVALEILTKSETSSE
jgi:SPP1 family predicted phage head-tail adaptor